MRFKKGDEGEMWLNDDRAASLKPGELSATL
jgi:hypothetical protein